MFALLKKMPSAQDRGESGFCLWRWSHRHLVRWRLGLVSVATIKKRCHELDSTKTAVQHIFGTPRHLLYVSCHLSRPNPSPPILHLLLHTAKWESPGTHNTHICLQLRPRLWCSGAPPVWIRHITALPDTSKRRISLSVVLVPFSLISSQTRFMTLTLFLVISFTFSPTTAW